MIIKIAICFSDTVFLLFTLSPTTVFLTGALITSHCQNSPSAKIIFFL